MAVLVLRPDVPFSRVAAVLDGLGWAGGPSTSLPPLIPGEPEAAWFRRGDASVDYEFDPVVFFRRLTLLGEGDADVEALVAALGPLSAEDVAALLFVGNDEAVMRGLMAAEALRLSSLADVVERLAKHRRPIVASLARRVAAGL
jgi:hypothetical protein